MKGKRIRFAVMALNLIILSARASVILAAEKLVGLQSAPSIAMALPWFAEEARLYPKYDLDFQLVYIASSGIVTAAMSGGNGSVAIVGGEGPIRAFLSGNTDFVFIGSCANNRISDLRLAAHIANGRKVAPNIAAWVIPGSQLVKAQAEAEGLDAIFSRAGFNWGEPGCSMCGGQGNG